MKSPNPGDKLSKQQVWDLIMHKCAEAFSDPKNDYEKLCDIFEACYGYSIDANIEYLSSLDKFNIYEDEGHN